MATQRKRSSTDSLATDELLKSADSGKRKSRAPGRVNDDDVVIVGKRIKGGLPNKKVECVEREKPPSPEHLFELHFMGAFVGHCESGKTNACVNMVQEYMKHDSFSRIFLLCPSIESNGPIFSTLPIAQEDVFTNRHTVQADIEDILTRIKQDVDDWNEVKGYYDAYHRVLRGDGDWHDDALVKAMNYQEAKDPGPRPCPLIILDDLSHSPIYSTARDNPFINLALRHRHVHGVGVTILSLNQTFRTGLPLAWRQNCSVFFIYRTMDENELEAIHQELGNMIDYKTFVKMLMAATDTKHSFLTVDRKKKQFRQNFDVILEPTKLDSVETVTDTSDVDDHGTEIPSEEESES